MPAVPARDAPAKINWTLEVLGRRPDGYHDIASVMSTIDLADTVSLHPADGWSITVDAPEPLRAELEGDDNLVHRAAALLAAESAKAAGLVRAECESLWPPPPEMGPPARIHLTKRIPAAGGLGGGSSDAAATLTLLHEWLSAGPSLPETRSDKRGMMNNESRSRPFIVHHSSFLASGHEALQTLAARLGSDVPFFLRGGTQLATGRGDALRPLPDPAPQALVLLCPPIAVERKTARLYGLLTPADHTDGSQTERLVARLTAHRRAVEERDIVNAFERAAAAAFPNLGRYRDLLAATAAAPAHLCGAGPSLFALSPSMDAARAAADQLRNQGYAAWAAQSGPARIPP